MSGALLLGLISLVAVADYVIALRLLAVADRADGAVGAAPAAGASDPRALRRAARFLQLSAPVAWFVVAALSFGLIPIDGIVPIKF